MAAAAHGQSVRNESIHDHIFADKLADYGDPREHIVRQHLKRTEDKYRSSNLLTAEDLAAELGCPVTAIKADHSKTTDINTPDGRLRLIHYNTPAHPEKRNVAASWYVKYRSPVTPNGEQNRLYETLLTEAEADHMLSALGTKSE
jgi:hypothetical protein